MKMLSRGSSEKFWHDIKQLRSAESATPEYRAVYTILDMLISSGLSEDRHAVINSKLISMLCSNLKTLAKDPELIDSMQRNLEKRFDYYFRHPDGPDRGIR